MPIALPFGPTIIAIQTVRYPDPEPTSRAFSPDTNLSFSNSKAYACYKKLFKILLMSLSD